MIPIARPLVGPEELELLREVLDSGWLTQGAKVAAFERAFAERHRVAHAVAVTSCTTALQLGMTALGIGPGDEVIVPSFTWVASANAVLHCGAVPVLCDVEPATFNIDVADALARVTPRTRAVMVVHLFGLCADVEALRAGLPAHVEIIEDAACAAGAQAPERPAGGLGRFAAFSFHPRKIITTGEGGMITTDDGELADRLICLRNHGASVPEEQRHHRPRPHVLPDFNVAGYNYRMTDLQGAVGLAQLGRLDRLIAERAAWAEWYRSRLAGLSWLSCPQEPARGRHGWQSFVTLVDPGSAPHDTLAIMDRLEEKGIASRAGTHAVHMLGYYRERFGCRDDDLPNARRCARQSLALPLHGHMSPDDFERVAAALDAL